MSRDHKIRTILGNVFGPSREAAMMALLRGGPDYINEMYKKKLGTLRRMRETPKGD